MLRRMPTVLLALLLTPPAHAGGCRGAVSDAVKAWKDLQIPVPVSAEGVGPVQDTLALVGAQSALQADLEKARRKSGRLDLAGTLDRARAWLDEHPEVRNADAARAALEPVGPACLP